MEQSDNNDIVKKSYREKRIVFVLLITTFLLVIFMFLFNNYQNSRMSKPSFSSSDKNSVDIQPEKTDYTDYKEKKIKIEEDYSELIKKVQSKIKSADTVYQQEAIGSYYSMEVMGLIIKQNSIIIEQNDMIIQLLSDIKRNNK